MALHSNWQIRIFALTLSVVHFQKANNPDESETPRPRGRADVVLDMARGLCILHSPDPYEIELDDLRTRTQLVDWVYHLKEKSWVTDAQLRQFVELITGLRGFTTSDSDHEGDDSELGL